MDIIKKG